MTEEERQKIKAELIELGLWEPKFGALRGG
jgi:hypothetical protein